MTNERGIADLFTPILTSEVEKARGSPVFVEAERMVSTSPQFQHPLYKRAFWANDYDAAAGMHHGRLTAQKFRDEFNTRSTGTRAVLLEDLERAGHVMNLDELEKRPELTKHTIQSVCAITSIAYAKYAKDDVVVSVKGARPASFFRQVELPVLMQNSDVTSFTVISRHDPDGKTYEKSEAYHVLRDEWLESSKARLEDAKVPAPDAADAEKAVYNSAIKDLATEMAMSKYLSKPGREPFSSSSTYKYSDADRAREQLRFEKCGEYIDSLKPLHPDLEHAVKKEYNKLLMSRAINFVKKMSFSNEKSPVPPSDIVGLRAHDSKGHGI